MGLIIQNSLHFGKVTIFKNFVHLKDITLDFVTSTRPLYRECPEVRTDIFHLGLITSCPRWVLVFPGKMGSLLNDIKHGENAIS